LTVPTDLTPVEWTRRYGLLYPASLFRAALRATFPRFTAAEAWRSTEEQACVGEYLTANEEWLEAVERENVHSRWRADRQSLAEWAATRLS
jgi:hypothetical protein